MTLTPLDFTAITLIYVGGKQIPWDVHIRERTKYIREILILGWVLPTTSEGTVKLVDILKYCEN